MQGGELEWYPADGVFDLKYWTAQSTFILKAESSFTLNVVGLPVSDLNFDLTSGWNLISVPVPCYVNPEGLQTNPTGLIKAIRAILDAQVYWPEKLIFTLDQLVPGNAYLIYVTEDCSLEFDSCK